MAPLPNQKLDFALPKNYEHALAIVQHERSCHEKAIIMLNLEDKKESYIAKAIRNHEKTIRLLDKYIAYYQDAVNLAYRLTERRVPNAADAFEHLSLMLTIMEEISEESASARCMNKIQAAMRVQEIEEAYETVNV